MDHYAVVGHPVKHSKSPFIHAEFAKQTNQVLTYELLEAPIDGFENTVRAFQQTGGKGINITLPFKEEAYKLANEHSELALQAGAANTFLFRDDGTIFADNTDGTGLCQDLTHNNHYSLRQKSILILGAGGATRNIVFSLLQHAPASLTIANRTKEKALLLAEKHHMSGNVKGAGLNDLGDTAFDLIINATSAGITGEFPELPRELIHKDSWCYDLFYADQDTPFVSWAKKHSAAKTLDGIGMLVEQAAAAFYLWRGVYPDTQPVLNLLKYNE